MKMPLDCRLINTVLDGSGPRLASAAAPWPRSRRSTTIRPMTSRPLARNARRRRHDGRDRTAR